VQALQEVGVSEANLVKLDLDLLEERLDALAVLRSAGEDVCLHPELVVSSQELDVHVLLGAAQVEVLQLQASSNVVELVDSLNLDFVVEGCKPLCILDLLLLESKEGDAEEDDNHQDDEGDHRQDHEGGGESERLEQPTGDQTEQDHEDDEHDEVHPPGHVDSPDAVNLSDRLSHAFPGAAHTRLDIE